MAEINLMKIVVELINGIKRDKTYIIVAMLTVVLIALMLNSHRWDNKATVPARIASVALPDFSKFHSVSDKKHAFFEYLRPFIRQENLRIRYDRAFLQSLNKDMKDNEHHHSATHRKLRKLAKRYYLEMKSVDETIKALERRVDTIPESLVLVQAANESAWGTSRFALEANNLFGQWCYTKGCGLVPNGRAGTAKHEVKQFDSPQASVVSYMRNLNTHNAYQEFRQIRAQLRRNGTKVTGSRLAQGLQNYSQRRGEYVDELVKMIQQNNLE